MRIPKQMLQQIGLWARAQGKKRPTTEQGWKVLLAEFMASQPVWNEIPDDHTTHLINDGATVQIADEKKEGIFEDDWDRMMRDRAKAAVGPNGELLDDFDQEFQMLGQQTADAHAMAPPSNPNPVTATTAILGGQTQVTPAPIGVSPTPIEIARWNGNDNETTNVTVTLGPAQIVGSAAFGVARDVQCSPIAVVQWGTRGFAVSAEVDIGMGTQFVIGASYVSLAVMAESLVANGLPLTPTPATQKVTGMLSFRNIERTTVPVTRSYKIRNAAGALTETFIVPNFGKSIVTVLGFLNENMTLRGLDAGLRTTFSVVLTGSATTSPNVTSPIFLPQQTIQIEMSVDGGSTPFAGESYGISFGLAL